jgi:hypothetical protein
VDGLLEVVVVALFLMVMLAPWIFAVQRMSGARVPLWMIPIVALLLGMLMRVMFGANANQQIGYYGAVILGLGVMAAAAAYFSGPRK